jgi:hypothetical protein
MGSNTIFFNSLIITKKIKKRGSVEILERNKQSLFGALCTLCFLPRRFRHPPYCDNHQKVDGKIKPKEGVRGCLPHRGHMR